MTEPNATHKRPRDRSPSYPGIALETALERCRTFYQQEGRHWAPTNVAIRHWGFTTWSGPANITVAAPVKFGLMEAAGKGDARTIRLTELGLRLVRDGNPDRAGDLRTAVLTPRVYSELWAHCESVGGMPSDGNLRWWLQQRHFTDVAIKHFIPTFKASIRYAGLATGDKADQDEDVEAFEEQDAQPAESSRPIGGPPPPNRTPVFDHPLPGNAGTTIIPILLPSLGQVGALTLPTKMSEPEWRMMLAIIAAYKPTIVAQVDGQEPQVGPSPDTGS